MLVETCKLVTYKILHICFIKITFLHYIMREQSVLVGSIFVMIEGKFTFPPSVAINIKEQKQ